MQDFLSTKSNDPSVTVLDVLVDVVKQREPHVLENFASELAVVSSCLEREEGAQLISDVAALSADAELCHAELNTGADAALAAMLQPLLDRVGPKIDQLKKEAEEMRQGFEAAAKYLASEDCKFSETSMLLRRVDSLIKGIVGKERRDKLRSETKKR